MTAIEAEITDIDQDIRDFKSGKITLEDLKALTSARRNQVRQRGNIIADTTNRIRAIKLMHTIHGRVDVPANKPKKLKAGK